MKKSSLFNRRGQFRFDDRLIQYDPAMLMAILGQCVVVRAEHLWMDGRVAYEAYSPLFLELGEGETAPTYTFEIKPGEGEFDGKLMVRAVCDRHTPGDEIMVVAVPWFRIEDDMRMPEDVVEEKHADQDV